VADAVRAPLLKRPVRGFTLIEVLVALAVFAIAVAVLVQAGTQRADNIAYLRDRTLADWIASDRITQLRLDAGWPDPGTSDGETEMAGRTWHWQVDVSKTPESAVRRVEVAVRLGKESAPLARVTGYLGDPGDEVSPGAPQ